MNLCAYTLHFLGKSHELCKVLSLGCGIGITEVDFTPEQITGVDIYDYSDKFNGTFIQHDVRNVREIIEEDSFDVVFCVDIIEHLEKDEGFKLIKDSEEIARLLVVFYTPIKFFDNKQKPSDWGFGNDALDHKSLWDVKDFHDKGYTTAKPFPMNDSEGFMAAKQLG